MADGGVGEEDDDYRVRKSARVGTTTKERKKNGREVTGKQATVSLAYRHRHVS